VTGERRHVVVQRLGRTDYRICWKLQQELLLQRRDRQVPDILLLTEHDHVYTIGTNGSEDHLLAGAAERDAMGVDVVQCDRGGDITYHGPGQIVGYPILDLGDYYHDLHRYLRDLEEVVIRTLALYNVRARRHADYTGVWVGDEKICAIGVKTSRWITMHGFALNVNTDLAYFGRIIPCGIGEKGVTSLQEVLSSELDMNEVMGVVTGHFADVFGVVVDDLPDSIIPHITGSGRVPA
jgi:lipoyl(octanoyl) transferase